MVISSSTFAQPPPGDAVMRNFTLPAALSEAVGLYVMLSVVGEGVPTGLLSGASFVHSNTVAFIADALTLTNVTSTHTFTSGPADTVGIGVILTVRLSDTGPHVPEPVAASVRVIFPEEMSLGPSE